jgi:UMF1 family MFS transporter
MRIKPPIIGWALYDFGSTIFSLNVISLYFALWVTIEKGREDIFYSMALSGSLLVAAILGPLLGAISDIYRKRMFFLVWFTCIACVFTAILGTVHGLFLGLIIFAMANIVYQLASVFYNALLAKICEKEQIGRVSGFGIALGYVGAIVGLLLSRPFVLKYGYQAAFIPTAVLFFVFSLPCFFLVKEDKTEDTQKLHRHSIRDIYLRIKEPFVRSSKYPGLLRFLVAAFVFLNAVNTVIIFMSVYAKKAIGLSDNELMFIYLVSTVTAIIGSFVFGVVTDRVGARKALMISLLIWFAALILTALTYSKILFLFIGPLLGIAMGSIWTASRALIVRLCPEEKLGEIFGIFGMVGKFAAIVGPLIWGLTILALGPLGIFKYRIAMFTQCLIIFSSWLIFRKMPDKKWGD